MNNPTPLAPTLAASLIDSINKLRELRASSLITPEKDKAIAFHEAHINQHVIQYADELLACWKFANVEFNQIALGFRLLAYRAGVFNPAAIAAVEETTTKNS